MPRGRGAPGCWAGAGGSSGELNGVWPLAGGRRAPGPRPSLPAGPRGPRGGGGAPGGPRGGAWTRAPPHFCSGSPGWARTTGTFLTQPPWRPRKDCRPTGEPGRLGSQQSRSNEAARGTCHNSLQPPYTRRTGGTRVRAWCCWKGGRVVGGSPSSRAQALHKYLITILLLINSHHNGPAVCSLGILTWQGQGAAGRLAPPLSRRCGPLPFVIGSPKSSKSLRSRLWGKKKRGCEAYLG